MTQLWHDVRWYSCQSINEITIQHKATTAWDRYTTTIWQKAEGLRSKPSCLCYIHASDKQIMLKTICSLCVGHLSYSHKPLLVEDLRICVYILCRCIWSTQPLPLKSSAGDDSSDPCTLYARSPHITFTELPEEGASDILKSPAYTHTVWTI